MKHTPGPWKAIPYGETIAIRSMAPGCWDVAAVNYTGNAESGIPNAQDRADGRLIAAAPELLEALEAVVLMGSGDDYRVWEMADKAIAKAKGGE